MNSARATREATVRARHSERAKGKRRARHSERAKGKRENEPASHLSRLPPPPPPTSRTLAASSSSSSHLSRLPPSPPPPPARIRPHPPPRPSRSPWRSLLVATTLLCPVPDPRRVGAEASFSSGGRLPLVSSAVAPPLPSPPCSTGGDGVAPAPPDLDQSLIVFFAPRTDTRDHGPGVAVAEESGGEWRVPLFLSSTTGGRCKQRLLLSFCLVPPSDKAISKSGAGQVNLLILEANSLHGVVSESLDAIKRIHPTRALLIGMRHFFEHQRENQMLAEWSIREGIPTQLSHDGQRVSIDL